MSLNQQQNNTTNFLSFASTGEKISQKALLFITDLIAKETGIKLDEKKATMIQSRISRRLSKLGLKTYDEYIEYLKKNSDKELTPFINSLTTNKTDFFREIEHFNFLKDHYLKELQKTSSGKELNFWSAACSMGHEVYTLALVLDQFVKEHPKFNYKILGTDIDTEVLKTAEEAIYNEEQISPIPPSYLKGNFEKGRGKNEGLYRISDNLKSHVKFRQHNLVKSQDTINLKFDVIFLRNVLIYFPKDVIEIVITKLTNHLHPGGLLFTGHSETLNGINHTLKPMGSAIYKRPL